jgi:hypothetical protein
MPHDRLLLRGFRRHAARLPRRNVRQEQQPNQKGPAPTPVPGFHLGYRRRERLGTANKLTKLAHNFKPILPTSPLPTGHSPRPPLPCRGMPRRETGFEA